MQESMALVHSESKYNYIYFPIGQIYLYTYTCVCRCACVYNCGRMKAGQWKKAKLKKGC